MIPVLETERLILRGWQAGDMAPMAEFYVDEPLSRWVGGPAGPAQAWRICAISAGHWALRGYGQWVLEDKASGATVGWCGLYEPADWPETEIGWALFRAHHGKGLATESAIRARDYVYAEMGLTTLVSYIRPENQPSRRLAERLGARLDETIELQGHATEVWRHPGPGQLNS